MKVQILEACPGGCHFGRDKILEKIVRRSYWKGICNDTENWVSIIVNKIFVIGKNSNIVVVVGGVSNKGSAEVTLL